jgi:hypothetical protein
MRLFAPTLALFFLAFPGHAQLSGLPGLPGGPRLPAPACSQPLASAALTFDSRDLFLSLCPRRQPGARPG